MAVWPLDPLIAITLAVQCTGCLCSKRDAWASPFERRQRATHRAAVCLGHSLSSCYEIVCLRVIKQFIFTIIFVCWRKADVRPHHGRRAYHLKGLWSWFWTLPCCYRFLVKVKILLIIIMHFSRSFKAIVIVCINRTLKLCVTFYSFRHTRKFRYFA